MDFFDTLRSGICFGKSEKSKHLNFQRHDKAPEQKPDARRLDFFGECTEQSNKRKRKNRNRQKKGKSDSDSESEEEAENNDPEEVAPEVKSGSTQKHIDDMIHLRRKNKINVTGTSIIPDPLTRFEDLEERGAPRWLQQAVLNCNFSGVQPIQMQAIPTIMQGGHVLASAPTGSGKTMAFLIPLLAKLGKPGKEFARAVVIDPTRELANQTLRELERLTKTKKFRGKLLDKMTGKDTNTRLDIGIVTPMRLCQLLKDGLMSLDACKHLVLDEADKLLDLGFAPQIDEILSYCNIEGNNMQIVLFSATMPPGVVELADSILQAPVRITIGNVNAAAADVTQELIFVGPEHAKLMSLRQLVREGKIVPPTLMFVQSKERAQALFNELIFDGLFVDVIHADRTRAQRDNTINAFRAGKVWVLICTDLMARGVDFKGVELVINYDMPQAAATYIHRIGRTGRAGRKGRAITLFSLDDFDYLKCIVNVMRASGCTVPDWMLQFKKPHSKMLKNSEYKPIKRNRISTAPSKRIWMPHNGKPEAKDEKTTGTKKAKVEKTTSTKKTKGTKKKIAKKE